MKEAVVGENYPPMYPWCRCTTVAVVEGAGEAGGAAGQDAEGKSVLLPEGMGYEEWKDWQKEQYGKQRFEALQKMAENKESDRAQYEQYRELIGKNEFTESLEAFQEMKYSNPEAYRLLKLDYRRQNMLAVDPSLTLPNASTATAADEKFTKYLFNQNKASGWAKGVAFQSRLGYNSDSWQDLRKSILKAATRYPSTAHETTEYGTRYEQKIVLYGLKGTPANVVVGWYANKDKTWLTTAMIKEVK